MDEFLSRTGMLIGEKGVNLLKNSHIAVFGLGGVGSYVAEGLARSGVGELTLIDNDTVSVSNINRQLYALTSTVGMPKVEVAKKRIADINPSCKVNIIEKFYLPENSQEFFNVDYTYVADAIDTVTSKIDLICKCKEKNIPVISCMGTGNKLDPTMLEVSDIYKTSVCPLCRVMRRELKKRNIDNLRVVYSKEEPITPKNTDISTNSRHIPGSISFVPSVAGFIICAEIVKKIIN